ncbi:McbB family protein [Staphylococcus chromogenes]|uniref:McbB family protein n=1 Tax=Staphylococcus chromogenes TaxID=46126 RepID=UPI00288BA6EB|nr:McbB family protein [Staphylococcus chromogenes]
MILVVEAHVVAALSLLTTNLLSGVNLINPTFYRGGVMQYYIKNFLLYWLNENEIIVQTSETIIKIDHIDMIKLVDYIDKNGILYIDNETIERYLGQDKEAGIMFMKHYGIIESGSELAFNIKNIVIISNNQNFLNIYKEYFGSFFNKFNSLNLFYFNNLNEIEGILKKKGTTLIIAFLNPYNKKVGLRLDEYAKNNDIILSLNFSYNYRFYISNLYHNKWKNPCHKCFINNIQTEYRNGKNTSKIEFQRIIDDMYIKDQDFPVSISISNRKAFNIIDTIHKRLEETLLKEKEGTILYNQSLEKIHECYEYNIKTGELHKDIAIYWEMCDCYG